MRSRIPGAGILSAAIVLTAFAASSALAAHLDNPNQLQNEGFEDPIANTADPFVGRWQPFSLDGDEVAGGDTAQSGTSMPRTDASSLELVIDNVPNSFAGVFQDVPVPASLAGNQWWFSGWNKLLSGASGGPEVRVEWRDSVADTEITRTGNLVPDLTSEYTEFILSDTVPAGANLARIVYAIQSFGGVAEQHVLVDDANFNVAGLPEPTTACLALLGVASMLGMRRRS